MSGATHGYGTTFKGSSAGIIGELISITIGGLTVDMIEVSNMDSPDAYKEFIAGMIDAGEITFSGNYIKATFSSLKDAADGREAEEWTVTFPDGASWKGSGYVSGISGTSPNDDKITADITIKLTGKPEFSAGS